jgi:hypothetical protein
MLITGIIIGLALGILFPRMINYVSDLFSNLLNRYRVLKERQEFDRVIQRNYRENYPNGESTE